MNRSEKVLYHQIHPLKLGADIAAAIVSFYFFWQHELWIGLIIHIALPIIGSALVIRFADLERLSASRLGAYIGRFMGPLAQSARLAGDVVMSFGAWYHSIWLMIAGLVVIVAAWLNGKFREGGHFRRLNS